MHLKNNKIVCWGYRSLGEHWPDIDHKKGQKNKKAHKEN